MNKGLIVEFRDDTKELLTLKYQPDGVLLADHSRFRSDVYFSTTSMVKPRHGV